VDVARLQNHNDFAVGTQKNSSKLVKYNENFPEFAGPLYRRVVVRKLASSVVTGDKREDVWFRRVSMFQGGLKILITLFTKL